MSVNMLQLWLGKMQLLQKKTQGLPQANTPIHDMEMQTSGGDIQIIPNQSETLIALTQEEGMSHHFCSEPICLECLTMLILYSGFLWQLNQTLMNLEEKTPSTVIMSTN